MKMSIVPAKVFVLSLVFASGLGAQPATSPGTNASPRNKAEVLSPSDLVSVEVFQEDEFKPGPRRVAPDGTITIALLDRISIGGKSVEQAEKLIREQLIAKEYLVNPKVTVTVIEKFKWRFTVTGAVQAPGNYDVPGDEKMNLIQPISRAGGVLSKGKSKVQIIRKVGDSTQTLERDSKDRIEQQFEILANDVITVPEKVF